MNIKKDILVTEGFRGDMKFVRFGEFSRPTEYKARGTNTDPPRRKGIYAFIYPYIDDWLWTWKIESKKRQIDLEKQLIELGTQSREFMMPSERKRIDKSRDTLIDEIDKERRKNLKESWTSRKVFTYNGPIWHRFLRLSRGSLIVNDWVWSDTEELKQIVDKVGLGFKRNDYSLTPFEVFIENMNMKRIQ